MTIINLEITTYLFALQIMENIKTRRALFAIVITKSMISIDLFYLGFNYYRT
ncbi:hypothetical protein LCGC14_0370950 [marine sediment metagenome]|uniref:Uncharacterized protein n=1 Tax=marine sediment metagenome TaxID=412755 RepID=A0A0F9TB71_9ZZZZ